MRCCSGFARRGQALNQLRSLGLALHLAHGHGGSSPQKSDGSYLAATDLSNSPRAAPLGSQTRRRREWRIKDRCDTVRPSTHFRARGLAHEERYVAHLVEQGLSVARVRVILFDLREETR